MLTAPQAMLRTTAWTTLRAGRRTVLSGSRRAPGGLAGGVGPIDLVLLDLMLPRLDGTEVCTWIRRSSSVPVIMLSAKDTELDKIVGLEIGADDYVTKPYSYRELLARLKAVLRRSRAVPPSGAPQGGPAP